MSERLFLRPSWPDDAEKLYEAIADEAVVRMLATAPWPYRPTDAQAWVAREVPPLFPDFLIFERWEPRKPLGGCGLTATADGTPELGYWIRRSHWHRGFATEAAHAVVDAARLLGHRRIVAGHFVDNPASGAVLRKLGFVETKKIFPHACKARGKHVPCVGFTLSLPPVAPVTQDAEASAKAA